MAPHAVEEGGDAARTIDDAVDRLASIEAALPAGDGVACFNRMYLTVTRLVRERVTEGFFADAAAMERLDVTFAGLYLAAYDAPVAPRAWRPLFARRADTRVEPVQFAIAGMNAHINHDLPLAVVATCEELGTRPHALHADYLRVNAVLAAVEPEVRESYLAGASAIDLAGNWSIERAREAAWVNAEVLWRLRDVAPLRDAFLDTLARSVGMASSTLLTPL